MFGKDIQLNFHNDDVYKTGCGGIFTILFATLVILFCMGQIDNFINKGNYISTFFRNHAS